MKEVITIAYSLKVGVGQVLLQLKYIITDMLADLDMWQQPAAYFPVPAGPPPPASPKPGQVLVPFRSGGHQFILQFTHIIVI